MSGFGMTWKARIRNISFRIHNTSVQLLTGSVVDPAPDLNPDPHQIKI
jgi:hypothetical protein